MTTLAELDRVLDHPMWMDATNEEIADWFGDITPAAVRERRAQRGADIALSELYQRLQAIASIRRHRGSLGDLLTEILDDAECTAYVERDEEDALLHNAGLL